MSKTISLASALLCTFIWGTTFIAQDTGMDNIGPFTFNAVRFFIGFLAIMPLVLLFEIKKFKSDFNHIQGTWYSIDNQKDVNFLNEKKTSKYLSIKKILKKLND